jgi:hypothetical protein
MNHNPYPNNLTSTFTPETAVKAPIAPAIKAVHIVYTVADKRGDKSVSVSRTGGYWCNCKSFACYGDCKHTVAVRAYRTSQGRKF